jgi:hypothetical protein
MKPVLWFLQLGICGWVVISGCRHAPPAPDVVAEIGGKAIPFGDFQSYLVANAGEPEGDLEDEVSSALFDGFLEECLITQWAEDDGLVPKASDRRAAVEAVTAELAAVEVSQAAIADFYERHPDQFHRPETVHLQQILLGDRMVAEEARSVWLGGTPFRELVALYSQQGLLLGSDEGDVARDELPLTFADLIFDLQPGEVSEVCRADYGFHLFKVTDRLPAGIPALSELEDSVRRELLRQEVTRGLRELVERARRRYNVRVFERNLPFEYTGEY